MNNKESTKEGRQFHKRNVIANPHQFRPEGKRKATTFTPTIFDQHNNRRHESNGIDTTVLLTSVHPATQRRPLTPRDLTSGHLSKATTLSRALTLVIGSNSWTQ